MLYSIDHSISMLSKSCLLPNFHLEFIVNDFKINASNNRKLIKKSTPIILFGVTIMLGLSYYVVSKNPTMKDVIEAERPVERKTMVNLSVFKYKDNTKTVVTSVKNGTKLEFYLSSNVPVHVALLASENNKSPQILFQDARIPPGKHKRLEKAGGRFIYEIVTNQGDIQFCVVQGNNALELTKKLLRPKNIWLRLPQNQCVQLGIE